MQQFTPPKPRRRAGFLVAMLAAGAAVALPLVIFPGCAGTTDDTVPKTADKPFAGATLTVSCPDARLAGILGPMAKAWAVRTGATVEVTRAPLSADTAQVGVVPFAELGGWAARGELLPVPAAIKEPAHPFQWSGVLAAYRGEPFAGWGSQVFGLPLAGDSAVLVYRADLFLNAKRPLPATWEDLADAAAAFAARDKKPALPPLPTDPAGLVTLTSRVAACYDRPALGDAATDIGEDTLAFQFRLDDARPRLDAPAFALAACWLADLKKRGEVGEGSPDAVTALAEGRAVAAVLTLDELARLKVGSNIDSRYGIAPLPGTRGYADPKSGKLVAGTNFVPYFGGGWLGVVRTNCPTPDAAFDLLAELGGPVRSQELVAATGFGPFRDAHLDRDRPLVWYGYGLDADRTKALIDAARGFVGKAVRNPTYGLRGPDQAALTTAFGDELKKVAAGEVAPADGMKRAVGAWEKATVGTPADKLKEWRRRAVGLN